MDRPVTPTSTVRPAGPNRRVFNVIVDATALIHGVRRSTRDGIKRWVNSGAIRLVIPMHTLKQLNTLKETRADRLGQDAKDTLVWLDQVTEQPDVVAGGWVKIQEGHEEYAAWEEVEHYLLPSTLLSHLESDTLGSGHTLEDDVEKLNIEDSTDLASMSSKNSDDLRPVTPSSPNSTFSTPASPGMLLSSPYKNGESKSTATSARGHSKHNSTVSVADSQTSSTSVSDQVRIPKSLQPLFNHIMWRINHTQSLDSDQGLGSYILLTNDGLKQTIARRFGIRVKRIEQLRDIIIREERDVKNRQAVLKKENLASAASGSATRLSDGIALQRPQSRGSPKSALQQQELQKPPPRIFDPNAYDRAPSPAVPSGHPQGGAPPFTPSGPSAVSARGSARARGNRGNLLPARGAFAPQHMRAGASSAPVRGQQDLSKPIDPDSYERRRGRGGLARGGRKLWEPT